MDLLRRVQQTRNEQGMNKEVPSIHSLPKPSNEVTRATIIEKKPKHKVLKTYFEELVEKLIDEDDS
jgi:hypothetical protein